MAIIDSVRFASPATIGQQTTVHISARAQSGGALSGELKLSSSNDVMFLGNPNNAKVKSVNANGRSRFTFVLEANPPTSRRRPLSVRVFVTVREAGSATSRTFGLVNLIR